VWSGGVLGSGGPASQRLPAPWRSLCDDTTLVVRDPHGRYWAHPWPTWSRFQNGGPGGAWDVQRAVPLAALFVLAQAEECRAERIGSGQAVSLLVEGVKQASQFMPLGLFKEEVHALHLEGFNNLCALARAFMRDAQIFVLDEPTSSMDAKAEYEVFQHFRQWVAGRTAVLISHRFSTVRMADRIYVLQQGRIIG
jgi:hypothetical protein